MTSNHEPREEFVQRLEARVTAEARAQRANPVAGVPRWLPRTPLAAAAGLAAVIFVSMGLGGAVVAARYQAVDNQQRSLLLQNYERRMQLAEAKLELAKSELALAQRRVVQGVDTTDAVPAAELTVIEAEVQLQLLQLQFAEAQASGREAQDAISAPLVNGRDFVRQRLEIQMRVTEAAYNLEKKRLKRDQARFAVGAATQIDVATATVRLVEFEKALQAMQRKIGVRQQFAAQQIDGPMAELRILAIEAQQRRETLESKMQLNRQQVDAAKQRFNVGLATALELKAAELQLVQTEVEFRKAELDMVVVQKQIDQRKGGG